MNCKAYGRMQWQPNLLFCTVCAVGTVTRQRVIRLINRGSCPVGTRFFFLISSRPAVSFTHPGHSPASQCRGQQCVSQHLRSPIYFDLAFTLQYTGGIEKKYEHQLGHPVSTSRFEFRASRIQSRTVDHLTLTFSSKSEPLLKACLRPA